MPEQAPGAGVPPRSPDAGGDLVGLERRYPRLVADITADLAELGSAGVLSRAQALSKATKQHFNHNEYPAYFFGDLDARLVLIHLNPKQANSSAPAFRGPLPVWTPAQYVDVFRHFG